MATEEKKPQHGYKPEQFDNDPQPQPGRDQRYPVGWGERVLDDIKKAKAEKPK